MISISFEMIFLSVVASALIGAISGILYSFIRTSNTMVRKFISSRFKKQFIEKEKYGILGNLFDCFFVLAVGLTYITSSYIFLDGAFEIYSVMSLVLAFLL